MCWLWTCTVKWDSGLDSKCLSSFFGWRGCGNFDHPLPCHSFECDSFWCSYWLELSQDMWSAHFHYHVYSIHWFSPEVYLPWERIFALYPLSRHHLFQYFKQSSSQYLRKLRLITVRMESRSLEYPSLSESCFSWVLPNLPKLASALASKHRLVDYYDCCWNKLFDSYFAYSTRNSRGLLSRSAAH